MRARSKSRAAAGCCRSSFPGFATRWDVDSWGRIRTGDPSIMSAVDAPRASSPAHAFPDVFPAPPGRGVVSL